MAAAGKHRFRKSDGRLVYIKSRYLVHYRRVSCNVCGHRFERSNHRIRLSRRQYCGPACKVLGRTLDLLLSNGRM